MNWLNPESNDFCGSGMNLREWLMADGVAKFHNSWANQDRKETSRRLHFVTEMILEQRQVHEKWGTFLEGKWYVCAGAGMDWAIEAVICGDKETLKHQIEMYSEEFFCWNYGGESGKIWAGRYAKFHKLCDQALVTWPSDEEKAQT